jgi:hypothetical protein
MNAIRSSLARPLAACLVVLCAGAATARLVRAPQSERARAAAAFLDSLDAEQRAKAAFAFGDDERRNWQMAPFGTAGVRYGELSEEQQGKAWDLLGKVLSERGVDKVKGVMRLEGILVAAEQERGRVSQMHGPQRYFFTVYGDPTNGAPWGVRVEGHHLSLNFTEVDGDLVTHAPGFIGSQPATVQSGEHAGFQLLGVARALLESLDEGQRARAHVEREVPGNSLLGPGNDQGFAEAAGLASRAMTGAQRARLQALIDSYVSNMEPAIVARERDRLAVSTLGGDIHFLWIGSAQEDAGHYWHVNAPHFVIEYVAPVRDPQHVHSSWRDLTDDFGGAALKRRVEQRDGE